METFCAIRPGSDSMTYDLIVAALIRRALDTTRIQSHERVLFRQYNQQQASAVVARLLDGAVSVVVGLPEDDGTISQLNTPSARWSSDSRLFEALPFVVTDDPKPGDPPWLGSQGFASRLRTSFYLSAPPDVTRVLLLFDNRPVETEQTTTSE